MCSLVGRGHAVLAGEVIRRLSWCKLVPYFRGSFIVASAFLLGSCSLMPASGPAGTDVVSASTDVVPLVDDSVPYAFVKLTREVVESVGLYEPRFSNSFSDRRPPLAFRFGIGDIVSVTIFEAAAGGLFIPAEASARPGNFVTLPNQSVDDKGNISVPYAGIIRAKGRTQVEIQQAIIDALKNRAIEPQAVVTLIDQRTSLISVLGEVNKPDRFPASMAGERILDALTRAGGPKAQGFDAFVTLEREGRRATVPFGTLVYQPSNNIYVHAGDTLYVYTEPQTFLALGATGGINGAGPNGYQAQFKFDAWRISLAEAVAKFGGLNDAIADPAAVFLYRGEPRNVAQRLGIDCSKFEGPVIPIIYNVNLRDPAAYFLAKGFEMRNKDVIYISNTTSAQTTKFLTFLRTIMATANDPIVYATNFYGLKAAINGTGNITTITTPTPISGR
jgi:polysaccharide export outer membrane protein